MPHPNLGALIARVWGEVQEEYLRETEPAGRWFDDVFAEMLYGGRRQRTYRERLDRVQRNHYGEVIPRIVTVRRNIREFRWSNPPCKPRLP